MPFTLLISVDRDDTRYIVLFIVGLETLDIKFKIDMNSVGVRAVPGRATQGSTRGQQLVPSCTELSFNCKYCN